MGFALLGGLLGLTGGGIALSGRAISVLTIAVGFLTLALGLSLLGVAPGGIAARLPHRFRRRVQRTLDMLAASPHPASPVVLGAATFFLPCGFTLSMQALALASGSFDRGAVIMGAFALGTAPVLFGVGLAGAWTKRRGGVILARAAGLIVVAFAVLSILSGASLFGFTGNVLESSATKAAPPLPADGSLTNVPAPNPPLAETTSAGGVEKTVQRVTMKVLASSFEPAVIRVKAGIPVEWTIIGENPSGCTGRILLPNMDEPIPIAKGESQVIRFTADKPGSIAFSCWMGMVRGKVIVN